MQHLNSKQTSRADQAIVAYFRQLADPLNFQPTAIPDSVAVPFALKSISYAKSLSIPTSSNGLDGTFIYIPGQDRPGLRHYGWDRAAQRHNLLSVIRPTEELPENYDFYRHVQSGFFFVANTVNGGAFAVQGVFNAISFGSFFPIHTTSPEELPQYKDTNYNVVTSVPVADGVVAIPPLSDEFKFRRMRPNGIPTTPSDTTDISYLYVEQASDIGYTHYTPSADRIITFPNSSETAVLVLRTPNPNPWGTVEVKGYITLTNITTACQFWIRIYINRARANAATYVQEYYADETLILYEQTTTIGATHTLTLPICFKSRYSDYEINDIRVTFTQITGAPVSGTLLMGSTITMGYNETYVREQRAGGLAIAYQSLTEVQLSVAGKSTFELVPNANLAKNLPIGYNVEIPGVAEIARDSYINSLGNPLRCVYSGNDYSRNMTRHIHSLTAPEIAVRAGTLSNALYQTLHAAAPCLIDAAGTGLGILTGNPMLGKAVGAIGSGIYSGMAGRGRNQVMSNSTCSVIRNSSFRGTTAQYKAYLEKLMQQKQEEDEEEEQTFQIPEYLLPKKKQVSVPYIEANFKDFEHLVDWKTRRDEATRIYQRDIKIYTAPGQPRYPIVCKPDSVNCIFLPTLGAGSSDLLAVIRNIAWGSGDNTMYQKPFREAGFTYTRFIGVTDDNVFDGTLSLTNKPAVDLLGGSAVYISVGGFNVDSRLAEDRFLINVLTKSAIPMPISALLPTGNLYITLAYNGIINGPHSGTSWHFAFFALANLLGSNGYFTGSYLEMLTPEDLIVKVEHAFTKNTKLWVSLGPDPPAEYEEFYGEYINGHDVAAMSVIARGGMRNYSSIYTDTSEKFHWNFMIPLFMLSLSSGSKGTTEHVEQQKAINTTALAQAHSPASMAGIHGRWKSTDEMIAEVEDGDPGPYEEYVKATGKQGVDWFNALRTNILNNNGIKVKNMLKNAEEWYISKNKSGKSNTFTAKKIKEKAELRRKIATPRKSVAQVLKGYAEGDDYD